MCVCVCVCLLVYLFVYLFVCSSMCVSMYCDDVCVCLHVDFMQRSFNFKYFFLSVFLVFLVAFFHASKFLWQKQKKFSKAHDIKDEMM